MTKNISEKKARQGGLGRPVLGILLGGLFLAIIAWGIAEIYGEQAKTATTQSGTGTAATAAGDNPGETDPMKAKADEMNGQPVDQNPKVDRNPTPQSSTGGDQQGVQPAQPAAK
ncbi:hypothetical protein [Mesorhizobium loti]|uniref:hypothetical protein n=1 Tax=Rhizobium loti TaxID=381 RepID=UPI0003FCE431|nr:hypothetical protein [Mesorhizobium loti]